MNKSCWTCHYILKGGTAFPGKCGWFTAIKFKPPKEIPAAQVDVGCKLWKEKEDDDR